MMNLIWAVILTLSVIYAIVSGNLPALGTALTESSSLAVEFVIGLSGIMAMWSGLMEIAEKNRSDKLSSPGFSSPLHDCFFRGRKILRLFLRL